MEYEKKYKEIIGKIRTAYLYAQTDSTKAVLEEIFPELKESEDDRIRKAIISHLEYLGKYCQESMPNVNEWIAWLEKQGEQSKRGVQGDYMETLFKVATILSQHEDKEGSPLEQIRSIVVDGLLSAMAFEKKELKKVEQKSVDRVEPKFHEGDWIIKKQNSDINKFGKYKITDIKDGKYWYNEFIICEISEQDEWELVWIEPKFHEGDWVVCEVTGSVYQIRNCIENLSNHKYGYDLTNDGYIGSDEVNHYHLWTIEDAKDGDVLVASDGSIFLFAGAVDCACKYYVALATDNYVKINKINKEVKGGYWETSRAVYPATKEQRDLLFQKMTEAGYAFDFANKELKKIEQKPTDEEMKTILQTEYEKGRADVIAEMQKPSWSEEDRTMAFTLMRDVDQMSYISKEGKNERIGWLNSLDEKFASTESAWSEEDERIKNNLVSFLLRISVNTHTDSTSPNYTFYKEIDWLRALKTRYTWKPSDEQMHYLYWIANVKLGDSVVEQEVSKHLNELYQDLKKLKEE